jgi:hypothetical protein
VSIIMNLVVSLQFVRDDRSEHTSEDPLRE